MAPLPTATVAGVNEAQLLVLVVTKVIIDGSFLDTGAQTTVVAPTIDPMHPTYYAED